MDQLDEFKGLTTHGATPSQTQTAMETQKPRQRLMHPLHTYPVLSLNLPGILYTNAFFRMASLLWQRPMVPTRSSGGTSKASRTSGASNLAAFCRPMSARRVRGCPLETLSSSIVLSDSRV